MPDSEIRQMWERESDKTKEMKEPSILGVKKSPPGLDELAYNW